MKSKSKALVNITPDHFLNERGEPMLEVGSDGVPCVSAALTEPNDRAMAEIALAIYRNGVALHADDGLRAQVIARWARQYSYQD